MMNHEHCFKGSRSTGTPTGEVIVLGGVNTYIARPPTDSQSAIIIATDIFGYSFVNSRLIADEFAKAGFLCVIPDLFDGKPISEGLLDLMDTKPSGVLSHLSFFADIASTVATQGLPFFWNHLPPSKKLPIFDAVIAGLKQDFGVAKVGVQGYCYGGKLCALLAAAPDKVDAMATAHPSLLELADIEAIQKPSLWCCAEVDQQFGAAMRQKSEAILQQHNQVHRFVDYPGTTHGFAVRGDSTEEVVARSAKGALEEAVQWFSQYLK
eukprot:TRINITY_DN3152_c0_g1_i1.p1 TRINITY_DN3152_c0_g1~~TRINITY_DN3152_c0_g1_i1.p1  ORF type:complete len:266 (-),score=43.63 TRINITY_DN3152_c0_g1_i1:24-821(-)